MIPLEAPTLAEIREARERIAGISLRTPLVRLGAHRDGEIHLKLETLQPIGSFKIRGAANAMRSAPAAALARGVFTASAGNMAQGVAWNARIMGIACTVLVPEHAPKAKLDAIERIGARIIRVPYDDWWKALVERRFEGVDGFFVHPFSDRAVIAGNGTIALEILEDLPNVGAVLVPYGGGGLSSGIAAAMRALAPGVRVYGCEVSTAAPLQASLAAGEPRAIEHRPSFVDGIGGKSMFAEMWPMVRALLAGSIVVEPREAADAVRLLIERNRVVAEGAGAVSVAAALSGRAGGGRIACVVSGGNIDSEKVARILLGEVP